jgi:hypothetical protein
MNAEAFFVRGFRRRSDAPNCRVLAADAVRATKAGPSSCRFACGAGGELRQRKRRICSDVRSVDRHSEPWSDQADVTLPKGIRPQRHILSMKAILFLPLSIAIALRTKPKSVHFDRAGANPGAPRFSQVAAATWGARAALRQGRGRRVPPPERRAETPRLAADAVCA